MQLLPPSFDWGCSFDTLSIDTIEQRRIYILPLPERNEQIEPAYPLEHRNYCQQQICFSTEQEVKSAPNNIPRSKSFYGSPQELLSLSHTLSSFHLLLSLYPTPSPPSASTPKQSTSCTTIGPCGNTSIKYPSGSLINANPFIPPILGDL